MTSVDMDGGDDWVPGVGRPVPGTLAEAVGGVSTLDGAASSSPPNRDGASAAITVPIAAMNATTIGTTHFDRSGFGQLTDTALPS